MHPALLAVSDNGYNVEQGSTAQSPLLFTDYSDHPHIILGGRHISTAAGRYQLLARYWPSYKALLNLPDFSPASQDAVALQQIKECHGFNYLEQNDIINAIQVCAHIWASFPGAGYNQHEQKIAALIAAYTAAGGTIGEDNV